MIQNYWLLAGLIGIYSMVKTNDPVVILVVGILSMFCFTLSFSNRPKLNDGQKISLWSFRALKVFFAFFVAIFVGSILMRLHQSHPFIFGYFLSYQLVSLVIWKCWKRYKGIRGLGEYIFD